MILFRMTAALLLAAVSALGAGPRAESNVTYGMYSGLALLMDVYHPERSNGFAVIFISGSGWHAPLSFDARPLKQSDGVESYAGALTKAGFTVFSVNHRAAPRFRHPAQVEDAQRAVRFIRYHAKKYGIDGARIGAAGGSSGGHLVTMLGAQDGKGDPEDPDPVNRVSAKVQCVVARAAPCDLVKMASTSTGSTVTSLMGMRIGTGRAREDTTAEYKAFVEASPVHDVSADDPPMLLIHGDRDPTVPFEQSELMEKALKKAGVETKLLRIPGGVHGSTYGKPQGAPDYLGEMVRWFERFLH